MIFLIVEATLMAEHDFRIDEEALDLLNSEPTSSEAAKAVRQWMDEALRDHVPVVVTDERDVAVGRVTSKVDGRYVWRRGESPG